MNKIQLLLLLSIFASTQVYALVLTVLNESRYNITVKVLTQKGDCAQNSFTVPAKGRISNKDISAEWWGSWSGWGGCTSRGVEVAGWYDKTDPDTNAKSRVKSLKYTRTYTLAGDNAYGWLTITVKEDTDEKGSVKRDKNGAPKLFIDYTFSPANILGGESGSKQQLSHDTNSKQTEADLDAALSKTFDQAK